MAEIQISETYGLPDGRMLHSNSGNGGVAIWKPRQLMVIIGKGSDPALELKADNIMADQIPVIRRETGGCAVVLSDEMLVVSFRTSNDSDKMSRDYFTQFNNIIIRALERQGITRLGQAGTSDIVCDGKKVAGSALYRNREHVFFHAVINLQGSPEAMERYLRIPPRYPEYRQGKAHRDFVTSIQAEGFSINLDDFEKAIKSDRLMFFHS